MAAPERNARWRNLRHENWRGKCQTTATFAMSGDARPLDYRECWSRNGHAVQAREYASLSADPLYIKQNNAIMNRVSSTLAIDLLLESVNDYLSAREIVRQIFMLQDEQTQLTVSARSWQRGAHNNYRTFLTQIVWRVAYKLASTTSRSESSRRPGITLPSTGISNFRKRFFLLSYWKARLQARLTFGNLYSEPACE